MEKNKGIQIIFIITLMIFLIFVLILYYFFNSYNLKNENFYIEENYFFKFEIRRFFSNISIISPNESKKLAFQLEPEMLTFGTYTKTEDVKSVRRILFIKNDLYDIIYFKIICQGNICRNLKFEKELGKLNKNESQSIEIRFDIENATLGYYQGFVYVISIIPKNEISKFYVKML